MLILNSSVVWVTLCREKTNLLSEAEFIMKMHEITDKGQLHLSKFVTKQFALYIYIYLYACMVFISSASDSIAGHNVNIFFL